MGYDIINKAREADSDEHIWVFEEGVDGTKFFPITEYYDDAEDYFFRNTGQPGEDRIETDEITKKYQGVYHFEEREKEATFVVGHLVDPEFKQIAASVEFE